MQPARKLVITLLGAAFAVAIVAWRWSSNAGEAPEVGQQRDVERSQSESIAPPPPPPHATSSDTDSNARAAVASERSLDIHGRVLDEHDQPVEEYAIAAERLDVRNYA